MARADRAKAGNGHDRAVGLISGLMGTGLVGRDAEMAVITGLLTRAADGGTGACVIEGGIGIGKTAVWNAGLEFAAGRGYLVLTAHPVEAETAFSFAALADLLRPNLDEVLGEAATSAAARARDRSADRRARVAARDLTRRGMPVRFVRSIFVPGDEICFFVFDAVSASAVEAACAHASLRFERVVEAIESRPERSQPKKRLPNAAPKSERRGR